MVLDKDKVAQSSEITQNINLLKAMQEPIHYDLDALNQETLLRIALKRVPWLSKFMSDLDDTGDAIIKAGERISDLQSHPSISAAFHFGGTVMAAIDFIRIPLVYLSAYLLDQEVPVNLDNNARWFYSGALLALTITALAVPATAPVIAFVVAGSGLGVALFLLGRTLFERYQLSKERNQLQDSIKIEEGRMVLLQQEANKLERLLDDAPDDEQIKVILQKIAVLQDHYTAQKSLILELKNKELHVEQKIKEVGMLRVLDKSVSVTLASVSVIGLVVSLFFPPVGLWILAGAAIVGGTYLLGRLATPLFKLLGNAIMRQFKSSESNETENQLSDGNALNYEKTPATVVATHLQSDLSIRFDDKSIFVDPDKEIPHESTTDVLIGLTGSKEAAIKTLHQGNEEGGKELSSPDDIISHDSSERIIDTPIVKDDEDEGEGETPPEHPERS